MCAAIVELLPVRERDVLGRKTSRRRYGLCSPICLNTFLDYSVLPLVLIDCTSTNRRPSMLVLSPAQPAVYTTAPPSKVPINRKYTTTLQNTLSFLYKFFNINIEFENPSQFSRQPRVAVPVSNLLLQGRPGIPNLLCAQR